MRYKKQHVWLFCILCIVNIITHYFGRSRSHFGSGICCGKVIKMNKAESICGSTLCDTNFQISEYESFLT